MRVSKKFFLTVGMLAISGISMESASDSFTSSDEEPEDFFISSDEEATELDLSDNDDQGPAWKTWLFKKEQKFLDQQKNMPPCSMEGLRAFEVLSTELEPNDEEEYEIAQGRLCFDALKETHNLICQMIQNKLTKFEKMEQKPDPQTLYNAALEAYNLPQNNWHKMLALDKVTKKAIMFPNIVLDKKIPLEINIEKNGIGQGSATIRFITELP